MDVVNNVVIDKKEVCGLIILFRGLFKFYENKINSENNFCNSEHH